ncbi:MAG: aldo/keto reductase [Lachnospiraceae bacterium]|nr:aldo/keto reductase [Lachnospiraceae bacterium]
MQILSLPKTDLQISEIGLGTSHFGTHTDREKAFRIMDRWAEAGGTLIDTLEECVREGKIRYYGCSNWTAERMKQAAEYAEAHGAAGFVCNQLAAPVARMLPQFLSTSDMTYLGGDILAYHEESHLPAMSAMSLCNGYFHKQFAGTKIPFFQNVVYNLPENELILQKLKQMQENSVPLGASLIRFILSWSFPKCALIGFSSVEQLNALLADYVTPIPPEDLEELHRLRGDLGA